MNCRYCGNLRKNKNSLIQHERLCKQNPARDLTASEKRKLAGLPYIRPAFFDSIEYREKQRKIRLESEPLSAERREKISKRVKEYYKNPENRKLQSERMKQVVLDNPESYSDRNIVGRSKHFTIDGVRYNSTWEYEVAKCLTEHNIRWQRIKIPPEKYYWNDSWHLYFPDFYLIDYDCYVEVKGYETDRDKAKWNHSSKTVIVIKQKDVDLIKKHKFNILTVVKSKSGDHQLITD